MCWLTLREGFSNPTAAFGPGLAEYRPPPKTADSPWVPPTTSEALLLSPFRPTARARARLDPPQLPYVRRWDGLRGALPGYTVRFPTRKRSGMDANGLFARSEAKEGRSAAAAGRSGFGSLGADRIWFAGATAPTRSTRRRRTAWLGISDSNCRIRARAIYLNYRDNSVCFPRPRLRGKAQEYQGRGCSNSEIAQPKNPVTRRHFALDFAFESVDGKRAERDYGARRGTADLLDVIEATRGLSPTAC